VRTFGKYRLLEPIASGGMADVWRAEVIGAEGVVKEVALKLVRGEHAARSDFVRMFVQEARLASRLGHANVVQVFEFDQVDGRYYIAMELVRGRHLGCVVERTREAGVRFGVARAVQIGADVARALAYAHRLSDGGRALGLVHRDVSPHNVLVSFEGEVKLADFGIARAMDGAGLTDPGTVKGKVAYMPPEQARGASVDARADVFSLGVVLWELCAGRRLFARDSDAATVAAVLSDEPISPPSAWNDEVPPELDATILGALERDRDRRIASAQDLATALATVVMRIARSPEDVDLRVFMHRLFGAEVAALQAAPPEPTRVRAIPMAGEPAADASAEAYEAATRTALVTGRRGRKQRWAIVGVVVAGAAVAAIAIASRRPHAGLPTTTTTSPTATATEETDARAAVHPEPFDSGAAERPLRSGQAESKGPLATATASASPTAIVPPSPPAPAGGEGRGEGAHVPPSARPLASAPELGALAVPAASSGEGLLSVNATPWGLLRVDGHAVGDTPQEIRLPAGRHRVRLERKGQHPVDVVVTVKAGVRTMLLR